MLRGALTVGAWTLASRVAGFARDILMAAHLGAGPVADAFLVALKLPNLFRRLFGEGAFNAAFVPGFSGILAAEGKEEARRYAEEAAAIMVLWLAFLTVLGEIFAPQLIGLLAPGFTAQPEKFELAVTLARITLPYLFLICVCALASGVLNGLDRFAAAAAAPVLFNLVIIAALLGLTPHLPNAGHALAWGVSLSGILQLALLLVALHRAGMRLRPRWPRLTPRMRELLGRVAPGLLGAGVTQLNIAVDMIIASLLPAGTVAVLYYADRVSQLPLGVIGVAMGTALLPHLSRLVRGGEAGAAHDALNRALEYAMFLALPAGVALLAIAGPVISVLFGRGAFDAQAARLSAECLMGYALGLPAFVAVRTFAPAFFARADMARPVRIGLACVALNLVLNIAFMGPLQHVGPALATSISAIVNTVWLAMAAARRGYFVPDRLLWRRLAGMAAASAVMAVVLLATRDAAFSLLGEGRGLKWLALGLLMALGGGAYLLASQALGAFDLRRAARLLMRR